MVEPLMTAHQVAELLGVHENWVYDQAARGELPSYKIGGTRRFRPDELDGWIAAHRERPPASEPATRAASGRRKPTRRRSGAQPTLFPDER